MITKNLYFTLPTLLLVAANTICMEPFSRLEFNGNEPFSRPEIPNMTSNLCSVEKEEVPADSGTLPDFYEQPLAIYTAPTSKSTEKTPVLNKGFLRRRGKEFLKSVLENDIETVRTMIEKDVDVAKTTDTQSRGVLMLCVQYDLYDMFKTILNYTSMCSHDENKDFYPLLYQKASNDSIFLHHIASLSDGSRYLSPLTSTCSKQHKAQLITQQNKRGNTPLMVSVVDENFGTFCALLAWGLCNDSDGKYEWLFIKNNSGNNLLHLISMHSENSSYLTALRVKIRDRSVLHDLAKETNKNGQKPADMLD
jgi:ankyrin repeat protein